MKNNRRKILPREQLKNLYEDEEWLAQETRTKQKLEAIGGTYEDGVWTTESDVAITRIVNPEVTTGVRQSEEEVEEILKDIGRTIYKIYARLAREGAFKNSIDKKDK